MDGTGRCGGSVNKKPMDDHSSSSEDADMKQFDSLFIELVAESTASDDLKLVDAMKWFKKMGEYNVPYGKKNRGMTVVHSYRYLVGDKCTDEGLRLAMILGWCVEWLQAYFLVADDIMDNSVTRRGQPCWYKKEDVGLMAINDSFYLERTIYVLLRKHFRHLPYYTDLLDLFHDTTHKTVIGQNLDLITAPTDRINFAAYTIDRYNAIVEYKTAYYSFYLPVACALYMCGISDEESHSNALKILLIMGEFFQIQDDYIDCFGDPALTGKIGTDIEDNKCSWLIVQALARATDEQRAVLEANYGRPDAECVKTVKDTYRSLQLPKVYADYEQSSYESLLTTIDQCSGTMPREMFRAYARKIYKRQK